MSSETVLFDATWTTDGARVRHELVARIAPEPSSVPVFQHYDLDSQFRVMAKVRELSDVPVPEVHWLEEDPGPLAAPFFIMSRAVGLVPPDVMPYNFGDSWVFDASERGAASTRGVDHRRARRAARDRGPGTPLRLPGIDGRG